MSQGQAQGVQPQAQAPQDGAVQPAPVPPAFTLGPGRCNSLLDYSNTSHIKTYYKAVTPLEHKFDSKPSSLRIFMKSVANQVKSFGWDNILNIVDSHGNTRSLLYDYRQLTTEEIRMHARNQWTNQHTRDAQNTEMLYHFLFDSFYENFKATILLKNYNYQVTMGTYTTEDGPCLLKQIIVSTFVDTRATASQNQESLVDMTQQLEAHKGNITKFNKWVEEQVAILHSRREEAHDLLTYLWKPYQRAPDAKFVEYIQNQCNDFITGKSDFTAQEWMNLADTMYKARVQMNKWALLSSEQEEIVALNAKIAQLEQANKPKCKTKEESKGKMKEKDNQTNDHNWMKDKPTGEEKAEDSHPCKIVDKKKYYWCLHHNNEQGQWVRHHPDECRNYPSKEENKEEHDQANLAASFDTEYSEDEEE